MTDAPPQTTHTPEPEPTAGDAAPSTKQRSKAPYGALLAIAALGLALRVVMVLVVHPTCEFDVEWFRNTETVKAYAAAEQEVLATGDSCYFVRGDSLGLFLQGTVLAREGAFTNPELGIDQDEYLPGAGKPPMMTTAIAGIQLLGFESPTAVRLFTSLLGAATVFVIGLVGRRLAGDRAGLIAAGIAALYPGLWINDWRMLNESFLIPCIALAILAAYHCYEHPRPRSAALLGVAIAAATLARSESLALLVFLVIPLLWSLRQYRPAARLKLALVTAATCIVLVLPWNVFVLTQFNRSSLLATGSGPVLLNGSCDSTFYGDLIGYLDFKCIDFSAIAKANLGLNEQGQVADDSDSDRLLRDQALEYIDANRGRLPVVAAARVGRIWEVYRPAQNVQLNAAFEERGEVDSWLALLSYYALVPLAGYGLVLLWRRNVPISPLVSNAIVVTLTAIGSFGLTRYRVSADVALVIAAAVGVEALLLLRRSRAGADPTEDDGSGASDAVPAGDVPPESATTWVAAARRPTRRARTPKQRRELGLLGGLAAAVVAVVVVLSAGVERPEAAAQGGPAPDLVQLCTYAKTNGMLDPAYLGTLDGPGIDRAIEQFTYAQQLAPPEIRPDVDAVLAVLQEMQSYGSATGWWTTRTAEQKQATFVPVLALLDYADENCPP